MTSKANEGNCQENRRGSEPIHRAGLNELNHYVHRIMKKEPFNIDKAFDLVREAVRPFPQATLFELYDEGFTTPFQILVACIISIRTYDEIMLPAARQLFAEGKTPEEIYRMGEERIAELIRESTFAPAKGKQIREIARQIVEEYEGECPCDEEKLLHFKGVGPKCANLVLGIACGQPKIGVDIHVHRVTNRWGYVVGKTPEKTMHELEEKLPEQYWVEINRLLVPFGKHICTGNRPKCSSCPLLEMCEQVGV